jgi:hypothetical protein
MKAELPREPDVASFIDLAFRGHCEENNGVVLAMLLVLIISWIIPQEDHIVYEIWGVHLNIDGYWMAF